MSRVSEEEDTASQKACSVLSGATFAPGEYGLQGFGREMKGLEAETCGGLPLPPQ